MLDFLKSTKGVITAVLTVLALLTTGITTAFKLDGRYAHAGAVERGFKTIEANQLRTERRYIMDKIGDLESREPALTPVEKRRLRELQNDLKDVEDRIKELRK